MKMIDCPKCGAQNSALRDSCFNCAGLLAEHEVPVVSGTPTHPTAPRRPVPLSSVAMGIIAGLFALPFGIAFLASSIEGRRAYGKGLCIGFGIQATAWLALVVVLEGFSPGGTALFGGTRPDVVVRVTYEGAWSGCYGDVGGLVSWDGMGTRDVTLPAAQTPVSANAQKQDDSGAPLVVDIVVGGKVVARATTTAAYGVAQTVWTGR